MPFNVIQTDYPSSGPHIAFCTQHSPCQFSLDLISFDFFLWGYLKSKVYLGGVSTLAILKDNMLRAVLSIPGDMLLSAVENVVYKIQCLVHEKADRIEKGLVLWCTVISSL
ncbi:hypothetical protein AVEN_139447-1 [Araneus ventricosus]|uniref:Uncharacterized protein n=1 Tax=Araneus ventricosus TaxID=182803 RepID=A0A4Y2IXY9_ARAVE|nr:hypothetical protein AVEN_139447-1 [Araneus ventricosus]